MKKVKENTFIIALFLNALILIFLTACATESILKKETSAEAPIKVEEGKEITISSYYDFDDVSIPDEFELKKEKSYIFHTSEFTTGLLTFSGRVETDSLISFFLNKMSQDGWRFLSSFKSPKNIMMFKKGNRYCVITIIGTILTTELEVFVTQIFQSSS